MTSGRTRAAVAFVLLAVAASTYAMLQSLVVPALGLLQEELDTDQATITWVFTGYLLSAAVFTPLFGRLGDAIGKKRTLVGTLLAIALGSLLAALAPTVGWLVAARVLQGAGGATLPLAFGIIRDEFPERWRTTAVSAIASLAAVGFGAGMALGGPITEAFGLRWLFWLPMVAALVAAAGVALLVPESAGRERTRLPLLPAVLLSATLAAGLLGVSQGSTWGWTTGGALVALGLVLAAVWVAVELRVRTPLVDMRMMGTRGVWTANLMSGALGFGIFAGLAFVPQVLQAPLSTGYGFEMTLSESGRVLLVTAVASFLAGLVFAPLAALVGARRTFLVAGVTTSASFVSLAFFHAELWQVVLALAVQGIGGGVIFAGLPSLVIASVPAHQSGVANGMNFNIRMIGASIGTAVATAIVTSGAGPLPSEGAYVAAFLVLAAGTAVAAVVALAVPDIRRSRLAPVDDADHAVLGSAAVPG